MLVMHLFGVLRRRVNGVPGGRSFAFLPLLLAAGETENQGERTDSPSVA